MRREEIKPRDDHRADHKPGTRTSFYLLARPQFDPVAIHQCHRVKLQRDVSAHSEKSSAFDSRDETAGHRPSLNHRKVIKAHVFHNNKIQDIPNLSVSRRDALGKSKIYGSAVRNDQPGRERTQLLGGKAWQEKHHEEKVSRRLSTRSEQHTQPLLGD